MTHETGSHNPKPAGNTDGFQKPNWHQWKPPIRVQLWQAVALCCDADPVALEPRRAPDDADQFLFEVPGAYANVLAIARNALGNGRFLVNCLKTEDPDQSLVDLATFGSWAASIGISLPLHMPRLSVDDAAHVSGWPWGQYDTNLLRILATAVDRYWKNYDPADPTTAPTNDVVQEWLKQQGVATRTAEVMATIMRADGLRTGPR